MQFIKKDKTEVDLGDQNVSEAVAPSQKPSKKKRLLIQATILVALAGVLVGGFFYYKYTKTDAYKIKQAEKETSELVKKVSKHILLPEGKPVVFAVEDPDMLVGQQAFFKGAEKGDSLLVYPESGKAIIYSKNKNIIVNVGPVTFD